MASFAAELFDLFADISSLRSIGQHIVDAVFYGPAAYAAVRILADSAQLQHICQHSNRAYSAMRRLLRLSQSFQRCLHRSRAGVIGIVDKGDVTDIDNLLTAAGQTCCRQRLRAVLQRYAVAGSSGDGAQSVVHVVLTDELQAYADAFAALLLGTGESRA